MFSASATVVHLPVLGSPMAEATLFDEVPWEYGICFVDRFTGRQSFELIGAGDHRSPEVAEKWLAERKQGNPIWSASMVARRRSEWEAIDG